MRTRINYDRLIYLLLDFKDDLKVRIKEKEYQEIIELLGKYEKTGYEDDVIPTRNELSEKLKISNNATNKLLKDIYEQLVINTAEPIKVTKSEQIVHIHIPYDEENPEKTKKNPDYYRDLSAWLDVELPYIPRIGERIELSILEFTGKVKSGYVHSITHEIKGKTQEIYIEVHPFDNEYERWQKMKETYEEMQLMRTRY